MTAPRAPQPPARILVLVTCVLFVGFGVLCILLPSAVARVVDIRLESPSAFADFRAMYGGLSLAIGALLAQGLRHRAWYAPSLFMTWAISAGLGGARLYSIVVSELPNVWVLTAGLLAEAVAFTWALAAYRRLDHSV